MSGLEMMCKAFGVKITPEQAQMIEQLIPQIPAKLNEAGHAINASIQNFDLRLRALEENQRLTTEMLTRVMEAVNARRATGSKRIGDPTGSPGII